MKIKFKTEFKEKEMTLEELAIYYLGDSRGIAEAHTERTLKFLCKTIEVLYKKGLIDKDDVVKMISPFYFLDDSDSIEIITKP